VGRCQQASAGVSKLRPASASPALDDAGDLGLELGLSKAREALPSREAGRVRHPVDEELAEQVIALVLVGPRRDASRLEVEGIAVAVEGLHTQLGVAGDHAAQVGYRQTSLVVVEV